MSESVIQSLSELVRERRSKQVVGERLSDLKSDRVGD